MKVHVHSGTIELIKLRVMSDESIARAGILFRKIFGGVDLHISPKLIDGDSGFSGIKNT